VLPPLPCRLPFFFSLLVPVPDLSAGDEEIGVEELVSPLALAPSSAFPPFFFAAMLAKVVNGQPSPPFLVMPSPFLAPAKVMEVDDRGGFYFSGPLLLSILS